MQIVINSTATGILQVIRQLENALIEIKEADSNQVFEDYVFVESKEKAQKAAWTFAQNDSIIDA